MRRLLPLLLCGLGLAGTVDDLLFEARHAQLVLGEPAKARDLYKKALEDTSLDRAQQAEVHYRLARCHEELGEYPAALSHLAPHIYNTVPATLRQRASAARSEIEAKLPKIVEPPRPERETESQLRRRFAEELRQARRFLESGDEMLALVHTERALKLDPDDPEAQAIDAEIERRLSGVREFIRDPLRFVRKWTETRITQVAKQAQEHLARAVAHADAKEYNLAWASFREAVAVIDNCEFGRDSDRLIDLRQRTVARWGVAHRRAYGKPLDEAEFEAPRGSTVLGGYLDKLQSMLDLVSGKERVYRIVPVRAPRAQADLGWRAKPRGFQLIRDLPSKWSPADFARRYLTLRVVPESWAHRDNYLDAVGGMLVARNRPEVLDVLLDAVRRLEQPSPKTFESRFLLVSVPRKALDEFSQEYGLEVSHLGDDPVSYRVIDPRFGLIHLCSFLRDRNAEVRPAQDTFVAETANGGPQTFFVARPLSSAPGYERFKPAGPRPLDRNYGLLLDLYPLKDDAGRTVVGLKLASRLPVTSLKPGTPRFLKQEAEVFVDVPPGATLVVAGLVNPFAPPTEEMMLLWQAPTAHRESTPLPSEDASLLEEVPLRNLILKQRDFPGPRASETRGFEPRDRLEVLTARAHFLEDFLRTELKTDEVTVSVEEGVARVPRSVRADAVQKVAEMERESTRSYIIEVHTRAVRSSVLARWLERSGLKLEQIDGAAVALTEAPGPIALRGLAPNEDPDVFAPRGAWPKPTALGLQARHVLSARMRTSPVYDSEEDLATGDTRTVAEGLRITVRPYTWTGNRLSVAVEIETSALESDEEERALPLAVPSRRTRFSGTKASGVIDLGHPSKPKSAIFCRIPHPSASRPDHLTEIVIALSVRHVP